MGMNFSEADTVVFWDVTDFPIRSTDLSYLETLRSILVINGYTGKLKITAYGAEKPDNLGDGVTFILKKKKYSRLNKMVVDISLWQLDTYMFYIPKNVMVITENIVEEPCYVHVSSNLLSFKNNCLWVLPDDYEDGKIKRVNLPYANSLWKWQDLLAGKGPMSREDVRALRRRAPSAYFYSTNNVSQLESVV